MRRMIGIAIVALLAGPAMAADLRLCIQFVIWKWFARWLKTLTAGAPRF
jgi:hypothetical protein